MIVGTPSRPRWACPSGAQDSPLRPGFQSLLADFSVLPPPGGPGGGKIEKSAKWRACGGALVANPALRWGKPSGGGTCLLSEILVFSTTGKIDDHSPITHATRPDRGPIRRATDRRHGPATGPGGRSAGTDSGRARGAMGPAGLLLQPHATLPANGSGGSPGLAATDRRRPPRDRLWKVGNANSCRSGQRQSGRSWISWADFSPDFAFPGGESLAAFL